MEPLNSAENVMRILFVWSEHQEPELGLTDISRLTGINKSTVYKILLTLRNRKLVSVDPKSKKYSLGAGLLELSNFFLKNLNLRDIAHPFLEQLASASGKTVTLALGMEKHLVFIDRVDGVGNVRFFCDIGKTTYYNGGAAAKAVFAHLPENQANEIMRTKEHFFTEKTKTWADLLKEVPEIRKKGYSISDEEVDRGVIAVGAPIFNQHGEAIAGIALATLKFNLQVAEFSQMQDLITTCASGISEKLGYIPPQRSQSSKH
ncbi:MAG: IclR family transcriptional regulator [Pyramidobacter sp.]